MADAFAAPEPGAAIVGTHGPSATAKPCKGYLFTEAPGVDFGRSFALVAYPARFGSDGDKVLCIDDNGVVLSMRLDGRKDGAPPAGEMPRLLDEDETPWNNPDLWQPLER